LVAAKNRKEQESAPDQTDNSEHSDGHVEPLFPRLSPDLAERKRYLIPDAAAQWPGRGIGFLERLPFRE
jgi:hypothetical protein